MDDTLCILIIVGVVLLIYAIKQLRSMRKSMDRMMS